MDHRLFLARLPGGLGDDDRARRFLEKLPAGLIDTSLVVAALGPVNITHNLHREAVCQLADGRWIHIDKDLLGNTPPKTTPMPAADALAWQLAHGIIAPSAALVGLAASAAPQEHQPPALSDTDRAILQVADPKKALSGLVLANRAGYRYGPVRRRLAILVKSGRLRKGPGGRGYLKSV